MRLFLKKMTVFYKKMQEQLTKMPKPTIRCPTYPQLKNPETSKKSTPSTEIFPEMCTTHQIGKYLSTYPPKINKK
jgi:hypothetical protein